MNIIRILTNKRKQKGFVAVSFAVTLTGLVAFAGLAIDAGYMQWNKRRVQMAADAGAMGALRELEKGHSGDVLTSAALNDTSVNGFTNGQMTNGQITTTVTVASPPTTGAYAGHATAVQVKVTRIVPTMFMRILHQNSVTISATGVAETTSSGGSIGGCIFSLNTTMKNALTISNSATVYTKCNIIDESNNSSAFTTNAQVYLNNLNASIGVVGPSGGGGWNLTGQGTIWKNWISPPQQANPPAHNITNPGDPLASFPDPSPVAAAAGYVGATNLTVRSTSQATYDKNNVPASNTIHPGVYCGGINLGDSNGVTYTFQPGMYILVGGGLTAQSGAKASGTGITFYNTYQGSGSAAWGCASNQSYSPMGLSGQGVLTFAAPTSGTFVGMLFMTDRTQGSGNGKFDQIVGGSGCTFDGAIYFKKGNLKFAGNSSTNGYTVIVADNITIAGNTTMNNNYTSLTSTNPFAPYSTGGGMVE